MTDLAVLLPYIVFCIVMTGTPGPNNAMALAAGVKVGFWRSMPLVAGIAVGVAVQLVMIGLGLGAAFEAVPLLHDLLRVAGAAYLLWLAWKIARSGPLRSDGGERPPLGFLGGAVFQWINPKAWAITTSAVAAYVPAADFRLNIAIAALVMVLVSVPCVSVWAAGGTVLRRFLFQPRYARIFNVTVALLLVATTVSILLDA
ncbi:LysE family translocator [Fodinicurvata fenggangensis]|uniref:LysE family translocator n=1 Tax=Fodinicurvata fenggangensis TaxID=1121830 RepID=UPI00047A867B|nr:LysE family translocator [Fodinicurvata fenggangensis]